jgi:hypothetical protein
MSERASESTSLTDLEFHCAGFVVKVHGSWTETALEDFRKYLKRKGLVPTAAEVLGALELAKTKYLQGDACVFVCAEHPCREKARFDTSREAAKLAGESGIPVRMTGCQGPCKQAAVLSLRVGSHAEMFGQVGSTADWRTIAEFAKRAREAGTLLTDAGEAVHFRVDPVHGAANRSVHLRSLQFLLGHFQGDGRYANGSYSFQKETVGTLEAGGRFIALRMGASYPLADGHKDVHTALVVVGPDQSGNIRARAYTDSGVVRKYSVQVSKGFLSFNDIPPGHAAQGRARKILSPTHDGFEERLEVDNGEGSFAPYYVIQMRKVSRKQ